MTTVLRSGHRRRPSRLPLATWAFAKKEALDVLRQPRLLLALVLGPFAILLLFGLGYRNEVRPYRTILVGDADAALTREMEASASRFGTARRRSPPSSPTRRRLGSGWPTGTSMPSSSCLRIRWAPFSTGNAPRCGSSIPGWTRSSSRSSSSPPASPWPR